MYGLDMKLAMVITYFGDSTYVFQFFQLKLFLSRLVYLGSWHYVVPDLFWNGLKSSAVLSMLFTLFIYIYIYICSCSALIYHYACLPDSNAPPKSSACKSHPGGGGVLQKLPPITPLLTSSDYVPARQQNVANIQNNKEGRHQSNLNTAKAKI